MTVPVAHKEQTGINLAAFEQFTNLPENSEQIFEWIEGEIVPVPSNPYVSDIASLINFFIRLFLREKNLCGYVTGEGGGFIVNGHVYAPDVAYISCERQPQLVRQGYNLLPPELAVEVISDPSNGQEQNILRRKVNNYLYAEVQVWVVNPVEQTVEVYQPGQAVQVYTVTDVVTAETLLPGFSLPVKEIFPPQMPSLNEDTSDSA